MKFLADESVDFPIIELLRANDYDIKSVMEEFPSEADDIILTVANNQERILITLDKDFGELVYRLKKCHAGVILIRLDGVKPKNKATITLDMIEQHSAELRNAFTVIQPGMTRIRKA